LFPSGLGAENQQGIECAARKKPKINEPEPAAQPAPVPAKSLSIAGSEGIFVIGAAVVVAAYVLFGLIIGEFGPGVTNLTLATLALVAFWRKSGDWPIPYTAVVRAIGLTMGIILVISLLQDLRFGFPDGAVDNIANLVFYAGYLLMFLGGRGVKAS
jgi:hypothetical protein